MRINPLTKVVSCFALAFAFLFFQVESAQAQQEKGDKELQLAGMIDVGVGDNCCSTNGTIILQVGYFTTRKQEIGFRGFISLSGGGGDSDVTTTGGGDIFYRYHFGKDGAKAFPYAGVSVGSFGSSTETTSAFTDHLNARPEVGFKYFFKKNAALDVNAGYGFFFKNTSAGTVNTRIGLSFIF